MGDIVYLPLVLGVATVAELALAPEETWLLSEMVALWSLARAVASWLPVRFSSLLWSSSMLSPTQTR